jgi:hypothetical protein
VAAVWRIFFERRRLWREFRLVGGASGVFLCLVTHFLRLGVEESDEGREDASAAVTAPGSRGTPYSIVLSLVNSQGRGRRK